MAASAGADANVGSGYAEFYEAVLEDDFNDGEFRDRYEVPPQLAPPGTDATMYEDTALHIDTGWASTGTGVPAFSVALPRHFFLDRSFSIQIDIAVESGSQGIVLAGISLANPFNSNTGLTIVGLGNLLPPYGSEPTKVAVSAYGGLDADSMQAFEWDLNTFYTANLDFDAETNTLVASIPQANFSRIFELSSYLEDGFVIYLQAIASNDLGLSSRTVAAFDNLQSNLSVETYRVSYNPLVVDGVVYNDPISLDTKGGAPVYFTSQLGVSRVEVNNTWLQLDGTTSYNGIAATIAGRRVTLFTPFYPSAITQALGDGDSIDGFIPGLLSADGFGNDYLWLPEGITQSTADPNQVLDPSKFFEYAQPAGPGYNELTSGATEPNRLFAGEAKWKTWQTFTDEPEFAYKTLENDLYSVYFLPLTDGAARKLPNSADGYLVFSFKVSEATVSLVNEVDLYEYTRPFTFAVSVTPATFIVPYWPVKEYRNTEISILALVDGKYDRETITVVDKGGTGNNMPAPYVAWTPEATTAWIEEYQANAPIRDGAQFIKPIDEVPVRDDLLELTYDQLASDSTVQFGGDFPAPVDITSPTMFPIGDFDAVDAVQTASQPDGFQTQTLSLQPVSRLQASTQAISLSDLGCHTYYCNYRVEVWTQVAMTVFRDTEIIEAYANGNGIWVEVWQWGGIFGADRRLCAGYSKRTHFEPVWRGQGDGFYLDGIFRCDFLYINASVNYYIKLKTQGPYNYVYNPKTGRPYALTSTIKSVSSSNPNDLLKYQAGAWDSTLRNAFRAQAIAHNTFYRADLATTGVKFGRWPIVFPVATDWAGRILYPTSRFEFRRIALAWDDRYRVSTAGHEAGHAIEYDLRNENWHIQVNEVHNPFVYHSFCERVEYDIPSGHADAEKVLAWVEGFAIFMGEVAFTQMYGPLSWRNGSETSNVIGDTSLEYIYGLWTRTSDDTHKCRLPYPDGGGNGVRQAGNDDIEGYIAGMLFDIWDPSNFIGDQARAKDNFGNFYVGDGGYIPNDDDVTYRLGTILGRVKNRRPDTLFEFLDGFAYCDRIHTDTGVVEENWDMERLMRFNGVKMNVACKPRPADSGGGDGGCSSAGNPELVIILLTGLFILQRRRRCL